MDRLTPLIMFGVAGATLSNMLSKQPFVRNDMPTVSRAAVQIPVYSIQSAVFTLETH